MANEEVERLVLRVEVDQNGALRDIAKFDIAMDKAAHDRTAHIKVDYDNAQLARAQRDTANLTRSMKETGDASRFFGTMISLIKFPVILNGVGLLVQGVSALGGGFVALGSAIAPTAGLLGTLPGIFTGIGSGAVVALGGIKQITPAIVANTKAMSDFSVETQKAARESLVGLTAAAKGTVTAFSGLQQEWKTFSGTISQGFLTGLTSGLKDVSGKVLPALTPAFTSIGNAMGSALSKIGTNLSTPKFLEDLSNLIKSNAPLFDNLANITTNLAKAFVALGNAAAPLLQGLGQMGQTFSESIARWAETGNESGKLSQFFEKTLDVTKQLISIFGDLWGTLKNVASAAQPLGQWMLDSFSKGASSLRELTGQASTVDKMKGYFESLKAPLSEMAGLFGDLLKIVFDFGSNNSLATFIQSVRSEIVPVLADLNRVLSGAFTEEFVRAIGQIGRAFVEMASTSSALTTFVTLAGLLAQTLANLLRWVPGLKELIAAFVVWKSVMAGFKLLGIVDFIRGLQNSISALRTGMVDGVETTSRFALAFRQARAAGDGFFGSLASGIGVMNLTMALAAGVALAITSIAQAHHKAEQANESFVSSMQGAFSNASTNGIQNYIANVEAAEKAVGDFDKKFKESDFWSLDPGENWNSIHDWITGNGAADKASQDAARKAGEEGRKAIDLANQLASATGQSSDVTIQYAESLRQQGKDLAYNNEQLQAYLSWLQQTNAERARTPKVSQYNSELNLNLSNDQANKFFDEGLISTLDNAKAAVDAYNTALSRVSTLTAQVAQAQQAQESAQKSLTAATKNYESAARAVANAQKALNEALKPASWLDVAEAQLAQERAAIEQRRANEDLAAIMTGVGAAAASAASQIQSITKVADEFTGKTYEVVRISADSSSATSSIQNQALEAQRQLEDARLRVRAANLALARSEEELQKVYQKGTEQDPAVIAARQSLADAEDRLKEAAEQRAEAASALTAADAEVKRTTDELAAAQAELDAAYETAKVAVTAAMQAMLDKGKEMGVDVSGALAGIAAWLAADSPLRTNLAQTVTDFQTSAAAISAAVSSINGAIAGQQGLSAEQAKAQYSVGSRFRQAEDGSYIPDGNGSWQLVNKDGGVALWNGKKYPYDIYRSGGGSVYRGQGVVMNEKGWELFVPKTDGYIMNHDNSKELVKAMASGANGGVNIENHFHERVDERALSAALAWDLT